MISASHNYIAFLQILQKDPHPVLEYRILSLVDLVQLFAMFGISRFLFLESEKEI